MDFKPFVSIAKKSVSKYKTNWNELYLHPLVLHTNFALIVLGSALAKIWARHT